MQLGNVQSGKAKTGGNGQADGNGQARGNGRAVASDGRRLRAPADVGGNGNGRATAPDANGLNQGMLIQALSGLSVGFILVDTEERILWLNRTAQNVLGLSGGVPFGRHIKSILADAELRTFWDNACRRRENCIAEVSVRFPNSVDLKANSTLCFDEAGKLLGRGLLFCDVTSDHAVQVERSQAVATRLLDSTTTPDDSVAVQTLTPQELRTLRLVGRGLTNAEICSEMVVAMSTVRSHLKHAYRKLGFTSRAAAARYAIANKLN